MRPAEALRLVALLQAAYPRSPMPDSSVRLYAGELESVELALGEEAVRTLARKARFLPSLAELVEAIREAGRLRAAAGPAQPQLELVPRPDPSDRAAGAAIIREFLQRHGVAPDRAAGEGA